MNWKTLMGICLGWSVLSLSKYIQYKALFMLLSAILLLTNLIVTAGVKNGWTWSLAYELLHVFTYGQKRLFPWVWTHLFLVSFAASAKALKTASLSTFMGAFYIGLLILILAWMCRLIALWLLGHGYAASRELLGLNAYVIALLLLVCGPTFFIDPGLVVFCVNGAGFWATMKVYSQTMLGVAVVGSIVGSITTKVLDVVTDEIIVRKTEVQLQQTRDHLARLEIENQRLKEALAVAQKDAHMAFLRENVAQIRPQNTAVWQIPGNINQAAENRLSLKRQLKE